MGKPLPIVSEPDIASPLRPDGGRNFVVPADVTGRFTRARKLGFAALLLIYAVLPWIHINGHPALFFDIPHRAFYLFGATFNAQDVWMAFFFLSGVGFSLIAATALLGRVWCGYACPQTVFLEGVFRRVERWIEGPRNRRLLRDRGPLSVSRVLRKVLKHAVFLALAFVVAHIFLSYFTSIPALFAMMRERPSEHPEAFAWAFSTTALLYLNFAWFREQLCLIVCPYGRLQSVLTDADSLVIGYDTKRGEPRTKAKGTGGGACVACDRCVVVCPTGIDIRNGLQLDCIGCAACIDACDEVMTKLERPRGLIRYDSLNGLAGEARRVLRPRIYLYGALGALGLVVSALTLQTHVPFEANLLRLKGPAFELEAEGAHVRNGFELHVVNKHSQTATFSLEPVEGEQLDYVISRPRLELRSLEGARVPIFVSAPNDGKRRRVAVRVDDGIEPRTVEGPFVAPRE